MYIEELRFILFRRRTAISLFVLGAISVLLGVVVATFGNGNGRGGGGNPFLNQISHNGVFLGVSAITTAQIVIIPLVICVAAGEAFAQEAAYGTLRYLLISPISRLRLLVVKALALSTYAFIAIIFMATVGLIVGAILFPVGNVTTLSGSTVSYLDGVVRLYGVALVEVLSVMSIVGLGVMASTLTDSAIGAASISFGIVVILEILNNIPQLVHFAPLMLSNYFSASNDIFRSPIAYSNVVKDLYEQLGWMAVTYLVSWARLSTKDITS
ncbi:MAG: ABC transporter permease subunit [Actinomycetota bacterium]|nr:ABC transporter permease subunit [Actinomycetota bacterium]